MIRALLATAATLAVTAGTAQANFVLHVLHTNDFHSRVEQVNKNDSTCDAETAAKNECFGGSARLKTEIDRLRKEIVDKGEASVLLDAGDQYQGSLFYNYYKGKDTVELMNLLGYDAMTVGNHEFDDGPMGLVTLLDGAKFPVLSANIDLTGSNELKGKLKPDVVLDIGDQKIAIIGATTVETPEIASPGPSLVFKDPIESIEQRAQELTDQGVDKIIALTHIGYNVDQELAAKAAGIDAIVGGHTHTFLSNDDPKADGPYPTMVKGPDGAEVPIVTALTAGKYLGHLVLEFDDKGKVVSASGAPILLDSAIPEDPAVASRVKELAQPLDELRNKQVAELKVPLNADRADCRARECVMGNVVTDAMLDRVKSQGIDIAIENGGGLRASIDAGPVTMGEVINVLPFQNTLSTFRLSGANILKALENGASQYDEGAGRFAQVAGLKYTVDPKVEVGVRISDVEVLREGKWAPIDAATMYGVVSNNYMRSGGDGYSVFATDGQDAYDFGPDLADVLADYLSKRGPNYAPELEGRITVKE